MFFSTYLYLIFIIIFYFESIFLNNSELFEISSWVCWTFFFNSADDFASLKLNDKNIIGVVRDDDKPY